MVLFHENLLHLATLVDHAGGVRMGFYIDSLICMVVGVIGVFLVYLSNSVREQ